MNPRYPVYIVSKGRWSNGLTTKALNSMSVEHYIVVEENEADLYRKNTNANIIVLPSNYLDEYELCDKHGGTKSKGPGAARNFCIDHSKTNGHNRHWVMDDNLDAFQNPPPDGVFDLVRGTYGARSAPYYRELRQSPGGPRSVCC